MCLFVLGGWGWLLRCPGKTIYTASIINKANHQTLHIAARKDVRFVLFGSPGVISSDSRFA